MDSMILQGKNVEDAIQKALQKLNLPRDRVNIEVLDEGSRGLLGIIASREARIKVSPKETKEDKAKWFVEAVCSTLGLDVEINAEKEEEEESNHLMLQIRGDSMGLIIGKRGQTIDALQYLTNLVANRVEGDGYLRIVLDAEGYRKRRAQTLESLAQRMAQKALRNKRRVILEPMAPHERRVIHVTLKDNKDVVTYSEGEEPYRKVIIDMKKTQ